MHELAFTPCASPSPTYVARIVMDVQRKLSILADAAKYDASCASSGSGRRDSRDSRGIGSTNGQGICHSFTPDGRCVSLLKILLTNFCIYDCLYCVNRVSSSVARARFTTNEVVQLTLDFYRRNYIEGLFLSSGIIRDPDYTMEQVVAVARALRLEHQFRGYIHLKTIPEASPALIEEAGRLADRISINIELPTQPDLDQLAPEKNHARIENTMARIRERVDEAAQENAAKARASSPSFAPAGQTTQMVIGATPAPDRLLLERSSTLYRRYDLRRVYYSAFSPIPDSSNKLPLVAPPLIREHRLYQADWLMRFYEFDAGELTTVDKPDLDLALDPKLSWALRHRDQFPIDVNRAPRHLLLRVPGFGAKNVDRILQARRFHTVRLHDLARLRVSVKKALPFIQTADHNPHRAGLDRADLRARFAPPARQLDLFAPDAEAGNAALSGQL